MFRSVLTYLGQVAVWTSLSALQSELAAEYEKSGFTNGEAKDRAWQEILRAKDLDITRYAAFREWKSSYLTQRRKVLYSSCSRSA
jgi:hypothetical protein